MTFYKLVLKLHLVAGLVSALVLIALGVSGSLLVFEPEIDHWLNAKLMYVTPTGQALALDEIEQRLEKAHPGAKVTFLGMPPENDIALTATLQRPKPAGGLRVSVNPYTGEELGLLNTANTWMSTVHQFHTRLLLGQAGKLITLSGALILIGMAVSGLFLWWPRKLTRLRLKGSGNRLNVDLHHVAGFYSCVFLLIFGVTGAVVHWDEPARIALNRLAGAPETASAGKPSPPAPGATPLSPGHVLALAQEAVPGARVTTIQGLGGREALRVTMKYPEDRTPAGRTNLYFDPFTGKILGQETSRAAPIGTRVAKLWNREIHTGDIFGMPTRILACVMSLMLPLLAITGPLIWLRRR